MSMEFVINSENAVIPSQPLSAYVAQSIEQYFSHLGDAKPAHLYQLVLEKIEIPLLQMVMKHARGNQCKASICLDISRGTLRKKLKQYGLD